jgi:hypothetical protein
LPKTTWEIKSIINPAIKNRVEEITKGCADVNPNLVAVEAEGHKMDKAKPATKNFQLPNERNLNN